MRGQNYMGQNESREGDDMGHRLIVLIIKQFAGGKMIRGQNESSGKNESKGKMIWNIGK